MTQSVSPISLYDRDLNLWLEQAIGQLKAKDFECLAINPHHSPPTTSKS